MFCKKTKKSIFPLILGRRRCRNAGLGFSRLLFAMPATTNISASERFTFEILRNELSLQDFALKQEDSRFTANGSKRRRSS
jgi:hypothetical protein